MTLTLDVINTIRRIQILSTQLAKDVLAGSYRSAFKGKGMEFEEVREYQAGDEVRSIDWNVTARMNHPYVKNFREERDLTVILIVDVSASLLFGSIESKRKFIAELGAVLAFSAIKNNDKVGLILFSDIIEKYIPPRKGTRHVLRVIRELLLFSPKNKGSNLKNALNFLGKVQNRSSICFIISDFQFHGYSHEASLISQKHDLISICVIDPAEMNFPHLGMVRLRDLETNEECIVDTNKTDAMDAFHVHAKKRVLRHKQIMNKIGADFIELFTDKSFITSLQTFFKMRQRRWR